MNEGALAGAFPREANARPNERPVLRLPTEERWRADHCRPCLSLPCSGSALVLSCSAPLADETPFVQLFLARAFACLGRRSVKREIRVNTCVHCRREAAARPRCQRAIRPQGYRWQCMNNFMSVRTVFAHMYLQITWYIYVCICNVYLISVMCVCCLPVCLCGWERESIIRRDGLTITTFAAIW